jgi:Ca2+-binding RTX toxin-like protein
VNDGGSPFDDFVVQGSAYGDTVKFYDSVTHSRLTPHTASSITGEVYGNAGNDVIIGSDYTSYLDHLHGGAGEDTIVGGDGKDFIWGDDDADILHGNMGNDWMDGGAGNDTMTGGPGDDVMDGGADDDAMSGGADNDVMDGGSGDDVMCGNSESVEDEYSGEYLDDGDSDPGVDVLYAATNGPITEYDSCNDSTTKWDQNSNQPPGSHCGWASSNHVTTQPSECPE